MNLEKLKTLIRIFAKLPNLSKLPIVDIRIRARITAVILIICIVVYGYGYEKFFKLIFDNQTINETPSTLDFDEDLSMNEIAPALETRFNVTIVMEDREMGNVFIRLGQIAPTLEKNLNRIKKVHGFEYERLDENTVFIHNKKCKHTQEKQ